MIFDLEDKHLGSTEELVLFLFEMNRELEKHRNEKKPLRDLDLFETLQITVPEIEKRIKIIKTCSDKHEIRKQSVHIANYAMMIFCQVREY